MENRARRRWCSILCHLLPTEVTTSTNDAHLLLPRKVSSNTSVSFPVIIGAMVLDIHAKPFAPVKPRTTTPGKVQYVNGGVARNVAECMSKLGTKPFLISVVGCDVGGCQLLDYWKSAGFTTEGIMMSRNIVTPIVVNIFDANGELSAGVASVQAVEKCLTPSWIEQFRSNIYSAPVLMVDANLHPKLLDISCQIAAECKIPVWFEPVSVTKSKRITSIVNYVTCTSPNESELIAMANALSPEGEPYTYHADDIHKVRPSIVTIVGLLKPAVCLLLDKGIKFVVVTLGSEGVILCSRENPNFLKSSAKKSCSSEFLGQLYELVNSQCPSSRFISSMKSGYALHLPALPASVVNLTGAGDCLVAGALASICSGLDIMQSMAVGITTAKAAVETEYNVPSKYILTKIADEARQVFAAAKMFDI